MSVHHSDENYIIRGGDASTAAALAAKYGALIGKVYLAPLAPSGLTHRGAYAAGTSYVAGDVVTNSNVAYRCIASTTGNAPPNASYWVAMVDDWARLVAVAAVCAGKYPLVCTTGEWVCGSDQTALLLSNLDLSFEAGAGITSVVTGTASPTENCVFAHHADYTLRTTLLVATVAGYTYVVADPTNVSANDHIRFGVDQTWTGRKVVSKTDAVTGNAQLYSLALTGATLSNTDTWKLYFNLTKPAAVPVLDIYSDSAKTVKVASATRADDAGGVMTITEEGGSGLSGSIYIRATVVADSGADNIMVVGGQLNLDALVPRVYAAGVNVETYTPIENCHVRFNGARIRSGSSGNRIWECVAANDCSMSGMYVESGTTFTDVACSWDIPSRNCVFRDCVFDELPSTCVTALFFECSDGCGAERCYINRPQATDEAVVFFACCTDCWAENVIIDRPGTTGFYVGQTSVGLTSANGSYGVSLSNCVVRGLETVNRSAFWVNNYSTDARLNSCKAEDCLSGFAIDQYSSASIENSTTERCGYISPAGALAGNSVSIAANCSLRLTGYTSRYDKTTVVSLYGTLNMMNSTITANIGANWVAIMAVTGEANLLNIKIDNNTSGSHGIRGWSGGSSTIRMTNVACNTAYGCYINSGTTHTYWIGEGCNISNFTDSPGGTFNQNVSAGPALTESTPLAVAFRGMTASTSVRLEVYDANGATAEKQPVVAKTPGTGFTLTSVSGDTRKINWKATA